MFNVRPLAMSIGTDIRFFKAQLMHYNAIRGDLIY